MHERAARRALSTAELVAMVAALSALNALAIDVMLPALPQIAADFRLTVENDRQFVIIAYVALFGVAQLIYGPMADAFGRRRVLIVALGIYLFGSVLCVIAPNFELFLAARALQGLGAAATRVIATAVVRDMTSGRRMAQIMSMAMTVFMIVPIVAPTLGQMVLYVAQWRWIFGALLIYGLLVLAWAWLRLPETLTPENRTPFRPPAIIATYRAILSNRQTFGYAIASTCLMGALFGYITASEQIYVDVYNLGESFPLAFGAVALAMSAGTLLNSRLVIRLGMRRISHTMTLWFIAAALINAGLIITGASTFWLFLALLALTLGAFGMIAGNFNALAMEPAGRMAGSASALYGGVTAIGGAVFGALVARSFDGTVLPFLVCLVIVGFATLIAVLWTERGRLFHAPGDDAASETH